MPEEAENLHPPPKSASLRILPEDSELRGKGIFNKPLRGFADINSQQPRALRGLARIVDGGLCHRCGSCVGICPTAVLALDDEDYPKVKNLSACTDCDLCVKVCPGDEFDLQHFHRQMFNAPADIKDTHGKYLRGVVGYGTDSFVRENSTSGGIVTALLIYMLENKYIDGALVIASDENQIWKGKPIIARSRQELLAAMKSKYAICPTNSLFSEIRQTPGRYALVGLPCQIHGYHKAAALDERLKERVALTIGLFCHAAIEHEAFRVIWEKLGDKARQAKRFVSRIGKHPGAPHLELNDGSLYPVYFGDKQGFRPNSMEVINILYRLYTPVRCTTCFDAMSDFADISVGDPWMAPPDDNIDFLQGWSFALLRSERGRNLYNQAVASGAIKSLDVTDREIRASNRLMASEKRWRAFRVIETHRRQGKPIPSYGEHTYEFPRHTGWQFINTELHMLSHVFCFLPRWRAAALRFFLGNGGYALLWLNNKRRALRTWARDTLAKIRRRIWGRS